MTILKLSITHPSKRAIASILRQMNFKSEIYFVCQSI